MNRWQTAQAVEFTRALRAQLAEMNSKIAWIERQSARASNARAGALRMEATTLRRHVREAEALIASLDQKYLGRQAGRPSQRRLPPRPGASPRAQLVDL
ncbi:MULTISPECIES: hypothetical protein [unclassified Mycobacterium]|uniref:hypothetical protein n=1 Tax=unclassified Mycobacterium TaxID=2642494 RepID=UPI0012E9DC74|nr:MULTISPECIES: hypothetical protein [unclassified Mycobacterium]